MQITLKPAYGFGTAGCSQLVPETLIVFAQFFHSPNLYLTKYEKGVEGNATLVYELTLVKFEKAKESWQVSKVFRNRNHIDRFEFPIPSRIQLDAEQKLEQARIFKEKGTKHFKASLLRDCQ